MHSPVFKTAAFYSIREKGTFDDFGELIKSLSIRHHPCAEMGFLEVNFSVIACQETRKDRIQVIKVEKL